MRRQSLQVVAVLALCCATAVEARLTQCRPSPNCGAADKPCTKSIHEGDTVELRPSPVAGVAVIRVRVCLSTDPVCSGTSSAATQALSVFGYKGDAEIYSASLNAGNKRDTGPYTRVPGLTRLAVRCNSTITAYCKVSWQLCKEELPVKSAN